MTAPLPPSQQPTDLHFYPSPAHPGTARYVSLIVDDERAAARAMDTAAKAPRGQLMTYSQAEREREILQNKIMSDEAHRSLRHRTVGLATKLLTAGAVVVVDLPLFGWLTSSTFNVDWSNPFGLPLLITAVVSILGTAGVAWILHHIGHNRRENKTDRRQLDWASLTFGGKISLIAVSLLVALVAAVAFERIYTETQLSDESGFNWLALLLSLLVAFVILLCAALVFFTAFRDGSPEQADLAFYSALVQEGRLLQRTHEDRAIRHRHELAMLLGYVGSGVTATAEPRPMTITQESATGQGTDGQRPTLSDTRHAVPGVIPAPQVSSRQHYGLRRPSA